MLPEDEQEIVVTKYKGAEAANGTGSGMTLAEQNQFLMMLLRAHCEAKQTRHVHDTAENRYIYISHWPSLPRLFSFMRWDREKHAVVYLAFQTFMRTRG